MIRSLPLVLVLCLQACVSFCALDLLPVWTDESFTVETVAHPVAEIVPIVQRDVHPPLYYVLLHEWRTLPLPWKGVAALRAFSAIWALLATLLLDLFWARRLSPAKRWLVLSLFAFSPCLLLYGRMARSYSMQTALTLLALGMLWRWMREPRSVLLAAGACSALLALLYTHYVPGVAVLGASVLVGWRVCGWRVVALAAAVAAGYAPWGLTLADAVRRWGEAAGFSSRYALSGNELVEMAVKIGFGVVSLTIGESFAAISLPLVPAVLLLALLGVRTSDFPGRLAALLALASIAGYLGVSRWASYPFIPARLLWLLPFMTLAAGLGVVHLKSPAVRWAAALAILASYMSSDILYFRRENFLNHGYSVPLPEIAATLNQEARPGDVILVDAYNTDAPVLSRQLSGHTPFIVLDPNNVSEARRRTASATTVWIVRNTRDASPGRLTTKTQFEACAGRRERETLYEPYAPWQRAAMKMADLPPLTHFYQLTACGPGAPLQ